MIKGEELLVSIRTRQMRGLRACFPSLTERDLVQMLNAPAQRAIYILQHSFDGNLEDAKAAWNDYVLRYIDGQPSGCEAIYEPLAQGAQRRMRMH
jgi:hypothetical protein